MMHHLEALQDQAAVYTQCGVIDLTLDVVLQASLNT